MEPEKTNYRPHIDGLRAIAVILVFLFHLNPTLFPGGYLGVDIFFVISGFVITQSLYFEFKKTGTVNIGKFYLRRFKRLYPALFVMVSTTTILYFFMGFLWNTTVLIKSAVTSIFAVSNLFYLKQSTEYFVKELTNPLLHTWSLGIEEQFYALYPLLLFLLLVIFVRKKRESYLALMLMTLSIFLYVLFVVNEHTVWGSFYWPLARFWELGAGCVLFFISRNYTIGSLYASFLTIFGATTIFALQVVPSLYADIHISTLSAVLAACALIFAGLDHKNFSLYLLTWQPVVYIGLLSYSLYLWHLPVIYFLHLYVPSYVYYFSVPILTFLLAYLSYTYIEIPLRYKKWIHFRWLAFIGGVPAVLCMIFILMQGPQNMIKTTNNAINAIMTKAEAINYIESHTQLGERVQPEYTLGQDFKSEFCGYEPNDYTVNDRGLRRECYIDKKSNNLIYLTGDSHATHFFPLLASSTLNADIYFNRYARDSIVNWDLGAPVQTLERIDERREELAKISEHYDEIYYVTALYLDNDAEQASTIRENLKVYTDAMSPYAEVILVAPTPVWRSGPETCVLLKVNCLLNRAVHEPKRQIILNIMRELATANPKVHVFDVYDEICPQEECAIYDHQTDFLWYMDDDHLSIEGSISLTPYFDEWFTNTLQTSITSVEND